MRYSVVVLLIAVLAMSANADGPKDNDPGSIRAIPPLGLELSDSVSQSLRMRCRQIRERWGAVVEKYSKKTESKNPYQRARSEADLKKLNNLASEILVFPRAVEIAIELQQFYKKPEIDAAIQLLELAEQRIQRAEMTLDWGTIVGLSDGSSRQLVVGGFESKIDGSYQPYAIVIPSGFTPGDSRSRRLDVWFHGRGETLSEVSFLQKGRTNAGQYTPDDSFVLHPYGRYSNAFKFAGEIDVLEAMDYVSKRLPVDNDRISARGFSMGGAACWQFATHYADRFFAANPGAGFSETPEFLKSFQGEDLTGTPSYQRTLWRMYDCPPWSRNLIHCPTVAYSGEIDRQKQAADVMEAVLKEQGIELVHIIGPKTAHKIHDDSKREIEQRMGALARNIPITVPAEIDFTTYTLRYYKMHWLEVHGLEQHWEKGHVRASLGRDPQGNDVIQIIPENVTRIRLKFDSGQWTGRFPGKPIVNIGQDAIVGPSIRSDRSWSMDLELRDGQWRSSANAPSRLVKRPGLQGPIDDAFMGSFLFVAPTGKAVDPEFEAWSKGELEHAMLHWRKHFRGDIRVIEDTKVTDADIANHHLVLFGDAKSNQVLRRVIDQIPIVWNDQQVKIGTHQFPSDDKAVLMVYPNPANPERYLVLNSGFTFREYDYLNNARQTPKLPDWAVVDISEGATGRDPGKIEAAGFFNEHWMP